ncbi:MAG: GGDEF domain-containing protein, partial [Candidatus Acidiferrales bacterium]
ADCSRSIDTAARHGGDEFAIVLPETAKAAAALVAQRICDVLRKETEHPLLSVSVGIATYPQDADTIGTLLYAADKALYAMKSRNSHGLQPASAPHSLRSGFGPRSTRVTNDLNSKWKEEDNMDESRFCPYKKLQIPMLSQQPEEQCRYVLKTEKKILQAISAGASVPEILTEICAALDCQIGNTVSLISTYASRAVSATAIAGTAARFGLRVFSSAKILGEGGQEVGSLEVYCCVSRAPYADEVRLMERARYLAALAIERENGTNRRESCRVSEKVPVSGRVVEWSDFTN